jgi:hypothetical protein
MATISNFIALQYIRGNWFLHFLNISAVGLGILHLTPFFSTRKIKGNEVSISYSVFAFLSAWVSHKCILNKHI